MIETSLVSVRSHETEKSYTKVAMSNDAMSI